MRHPPHARGCDLRYTSTNNIMTIQAKSFMHTAVVVAALACADVATAQAPATRQGAATRPEAAPSGQPAAPRMELTKQDREFFKNAAEQCIVEGELAKMGQTKATDPALKRIAAELVKDHIKVDNELMALARQKGVELPREPSSAQRRMISALAAKSGPAFDSELREHLAKDHEKGIRMLQETERGTRDAEIRAFAARQLPVLQQHLAEVQGRADTRTTERRRESGTAAPSREPAGSGRVRTE